MTADDYQFVDGDIDKIELGGTLLPQRHEEHQTAAATLTEFGADVAGGVSLKGEDLVFLMEAAKRLWRVGHSQNPQKSTFSRIISAAQAAATLGGIEGLFGGRFLHSLPAANTYRRLSSNEIDTLGLDILTSGDMAAMEPRPTAGGKITAEPFLAAFKNLKKVEGRFGEAVGAIKAATPALKVLWSVGTNVTASSSANFQTTFATEAHYSVSGRENQTEHFYGFAYAEGPNNPTPSRWIPPGETDHAFTGLSIMPATTYTVSASIYEVSQPPSDGGTGTVLRNESWSGNVVIFGGWFSSPAYIPNYFVTFNEWESLLSKCCAAIGAPWDEIRADVSGYRGGIIQKSITATPAKQFYIATVDDCIKAAL